MADHARPPGGLDHRPALGHRVREGLLHVDVLARLGGLDEREAVPVLRGGDQHRVDVLAIEDPLVLDDQVRLLRPVAFRQDLGGLVHARLEDVGDHRHVHVGELAEDGQQFPAAAAAADQADPHAAVGQGLARGQDGRGQSRGGGQCLQKTSA